MSRSSVASRLRETVFGLAPDEASFAKRRFAPTTDAKREQLEQSGGAFVAGFNQGVATADPTRAAAECDRQPVLLRGFAYEGAAMAFALLDLLTTMAPSRWRAFRDGAASPHLYMVHVGAGWALARCPWGLATFWPKLDPLLRSLAADGIGFHAAFFHPEAVIDRWRRPLVRRWAPDEFDNGAGRALWFVCGARADVVAARAAACEASRRAALWAGVGLAAAYAGGAEDGDWTLLLQGAGDHRDQLALGCAWAAGARRRAGNPADHTDRACRIVCGCSADAAAAATVASAGAVPAAADSYRGWRQRTIAALGRAPIA